MRRPGLRVRILATFTLGALALSATVAFASYAITESNLIRNRERSALRTAYYDATVANAGLSGEDPSVMQVLRSMDTGSTRHVVLYREGRFYARNADAGYTSALPDRLRAAVAGGRPATQRVRTQSGPALAIGIPLPDGSQFYIIDSLVELDRTLRTMSWVLTLVAAATTAAGAALGAYAARRVVRPLDVVAQAAQDIADGDLTARLDPATEPDLRRLTTSFNHMVNQLATRLERDRRFAADVSHELRSPLQTLSAAGSVLQRRRDHLDTRTATAVGLIADEVDRFTILVTDLLELARADLPADLTPVDVADLARQACGSVGVSPDLVRVAGATPPVWCLDRRRMEQAIANLLTNAAKHGGGAVAIAIDTDGSTLTIAVDDEGPGVPPGDREAVFDRFVRGRTANARADCDGTGLGLAIVAQHVQAHGGTVAVTDRPGGGARFQIRLPSLPRSEQM
jgi:signal transduction histidine kinase